MQKTKVRPFKILTNSQNEEAKLVLTTRKEIKIRINKPKPKNKLFRTAAKSQDQFLPTLSLPVLSQVKKLTFYLNNKEDDSINAQAPFRSSDNLHKLQQLSWEVKSLSIDSPKLANRPSTSSESFISPAVLPNIYSLRPFLAPFITAASLAFPQVETMKNHEYLNWTLQNSFGDKPNGREGCQLVYLRGTVYLLGGQSRIKHNDVRSLDVQSWTWRVINTKYTPPGRLGHIAVPYKGKLVLYGGQSQHSQNLGIRRCSRKVYYLSLKTKTWQFYSGEGEKPEGRRDHAGGYIGRYFVIYGGLSQQGRALSDLRVLDMKIKKWIFPDIVMHNDPGPRSHSTLTGIFGQSVIETFNENAFDLSKGKSEFLNSGFYLFGGLNGQGKVVNSLHGLYMRNGKLVWTLIDNYIGNAPSARCNHTASGVRNILYIFGGRNDEIYKSSGDSCLDDLHCFDVSSLIWKDLKVVGESPDGRWAHSMVSMNGKILIFGGISIKQFLPSDLYKLEYQDERSDKQKEEDLMIDLDNELLFFNDVDDKE